MAEKLNTARFGKSVRVSKTADEESRAIIYEGANMSQLTIIFHQNEKDLKRRMYGLAPVGSRNGVPIYAIHEVAPYVVAPKFDVEQYIKRMNHTELPKMLTKEFWAGQRSRQEYLIKNGDLWPTERVIEEVGELFKLIKTQIRLTVDTIERQSELTLKQRGIIKSLLDGTLRDLHQTIVDKFKTRPPEKSEFVGDGTITLDMETDAPDAEGDEA
jgi:hypothetical protein